ncbi:Biopolymer transport protein ExbD1 [uncultured Candidatus Thioglobus sp.]|nr:Biopolymer transport protein ExbD1 [uncultured Candidatus Thioglobus sp.]
MIKVDEDYFSAENASLDLTPLLDIMFILLVFFMLTSGNIAQSLKMVLPENVQKALPNMNANKHILLEIGKKSYALDGKKFKHFSQLPGLLKNKDLNKNKLVIANDKDTRVETFLQVLTFLQQSGIKNTNILMKNQP